MTATITDVFKKQIMQDLFDDVSDSSQRYYIGIGRSEVWDDSDIAPTPINNERDVRNARLTLQSIKSAEDVSFVIPRNSWTSGTIYSAWDDNQTGYPSAKYYVITEDNQVYVCLQRSVDGTGATVTSTVKPTGVTTNAFTTSDGYTWKFLYTIPAANASKYLSSNYMPVRLMGTTDSNSSTIDIEQKTIQNAAVAGQISSIAIMTGGAGYTSVPSVSIVGNGDSAQATATISSGAVVKIEIDNDSAAMGTAYDYADVVLSGGGFTTTATARAVLSPGTGFGADPRDDLKSTGLMFNTKPDGEESGDFIIGQDFRQIVLMKNPTVPSTDSAFSASTGLVLRSLTLGTINTAFTPDKTIVGGSSGATAIVDKYDASNSKVYYHQSEDTGFTAFTEGEALTENNGSGDGILDSAGVDSDSRAFNYGEVNSLSGDVLYIDNRAAVDRSTEQTEDLKIIIQI